jgi:hypothetical protein
MYLDAAEIFWQDWIVSYDLERQLLLAERMGKSSKALSIEWPEHWKDTGGWIAAAIAYWPYALAALLLGVAAWLFGPVWHRWWRIQSRVRTIRRGRGNASDATLLYERLLAILKSRGKEKPAWMTPSEFARIVEVPLVLEITACYLRLRYGGDTAAAGKMAGLLVQLEQQR